MRATSISHRFILSTILIVILTIVIVALPALWAIWRQLENRVSIRIQDTQAATLALYDAERDRLDTLAISMAQNQTICALIQHGDLSALESYLEELGQDAQLDAMLVITPNHQKVGYATIELPPPDNLFNNQDQFSADLIVHNDPPQLLVLAVREVQHAEDCEESGAAWLMVARVLDDDYMHSLTQQTGVDHSLIVGQRRIATSLSNAPELAIDPNAASEILIKGTDCCRRETSNGVQYYFGLVPIRNNNGNIIALSEVSLSAGTIRSELLSTTILLFIVGVVVAVGGSILAIILTRRITRKLSYLAEAGERMGEGDLDTPISIKSDLKEINQLTAQLDRARTNLLHAQQTAEDERERIEHLLEAINDGVIVLNGEDLVTFFNTSAERKLGLRASEVLGKHFSQVFRPVSSESITLQDVIHPRAGTPPIHHLTVIGANGLPITLAISLSRLNANSSPSRSQERVLVVRDISEEEAINQLRSNFLANVSHEFRTPLSAVIATTEMLIEESSHLTSDEIHELANSIRLGNFRLQTLVDNLLDSATIVAGRFKVHCRPTQIRSIIDNASEAMAPLLNRRRQKLELKFEGKIPSILGDPDRLTQVLINLLANASKFGPMGIDIILSVYKDHDNITIAVLDSGPGLPAGRYSDLFKRFVTGEHTRGARYGVGLGLSVVKAIVEAHGGQVGAENRLNGGAKVWFTLPLNPQEGC